MSEGEEYTKQIDRLLIIDEPSLTCNLTRDVYRALLHFLLLADNTDPSYRTPRLGVSLLQTSSQQIIPFIMFPFQPLNKAALIKFKFMLKQSNVNINNSPIMEDKLSYLDKKHWTHILIECVKSQLQPIIAAHHDSSIGCEFILTVITGRTIVWVENSLKFLNSISVIKNIIVRKIEMVCITNIENCLQDSSLDQNEYEPTQITNSLSEGHIKNCSLSQSIAEASFKAEVNVRTLSVMANEVSLLQFFKSWLTFQNNHSEDIKLQIGQLTLKCDIQDCILRTDWLPFQNSFHINEIQSQNESINHNSKHCITLRQKQASIELTNVSVIEESGVCESVLFGTPRLLKPTSFWKLDWEDLERNQVLFLTLAQKLSERKQCLVVKQSNNVDMRGRHMPSGHFLVLSSEKNAGGMLIKPIITRELVIEAGWDPIINQNVDEYVQQEVRCMLDSLPLYGEYNPLNHESGLYACLENLYDKVKPTGNVQRYMGSVRNERGFIGAIPSRKSIARGKKKIAFVQGSHSKEPGERITSNNNQPLYKHYNIDDPYLSPTGDYSFD